MTEHAPTSRSRRGLRDLFASFGLSYALAVLLIGALVYHAGVWNVLANTRLLDPLIEGGVIRYHDGQIGAVDGIDKPKTYLYSQDPVDYRLVLLAALVYFFYWGFKGVMFHGAGRFVGLRGRPGPHARAWLYGEGLGRFFPFRFQEAATAEALEAQGEDPKAVQRSFSVVEFLTMVFQIGLFWTFGLLVASYSAWFIQSFWAIVICAVAYFVLRGTGLLPWGRDGFLRTQRGVYRALADRPSTFARLGGLAALVMLLDHLTPYVIAQAFTGDHVILNVPFFVIQSGVVAGYIAMRFPVTPLGIGQWEWAFALALYFSGVGFPEAATIALLDSVLRHGTGFVVFLVVTLWYGVPTTFQNVLRRYLGEPAPARAPVPDEGNGLAAAQRSHA